MIRSFRDADTERVFGRERSRRLPPDVQRRAHRKLLLLDAAEALQDLRIPPGNRLERLSGDRAGQHSIRKRFRGWRADRGSVRSGARRVPDTAVQLAAQVVRPATSLHRHRASWQIRDIGNHTVSLQALPHNNPAPRIHWARAFQRT